MNYENQDDDGLVTDLCAEDSDIEDWLWPDNESLATHLAGEY